MEIATDKGGNIIVGAENNLYLFNGENWKRIAVEGNPILFKSIGDTIYVAVSAQIYILQNTDLQGYALIPMPIDTSLINGSIQSLAVQGKRILFADDNNLHWYDNGMHQILTGSPKGAKCYLLSGRFYIYFPGKGVFTVDEKGIDNYNSFLFEKNRKQLFLRGINNKFLLFYKNPVEIFSLSPGKKQKILNQWWPYLDKKGFEQVEAAGEYIFITSTEDIHVVDEKGSMEILHVPMDEFTRSGMIDMTYHSSGILWILHPTGIQSIRYPNIYKTYGKTYGLSGAIMDIERHDNVLYIATSTGIFMLNDGGSGFSPVLLNQPTRPNGFFKMGGGLFCTTKNGIINCSRKNFHDLGEDGIAQSILNPKYPNLLFLSSGKKLLVYKYNDFDLKAIGKINVGVGEISKITVDGDGMFYLLNKKLQVFMLSLDISKNLTSFRVYKEEIILEKIEKPMDILSHGSDLLVNSPGGLYKYDLITERVIPLKILLNNKLQDYWLHPLQKNDRQEIFFIVETKESGRNYFMKATLKESIIAPGIVLPVLPRMANAAAIYIDDTLDAAWIAHPNSLIQLPLKRQDLSTLKPRVKFVHVEMGNDSLINFTGREQLDFPILKVKREMGDFEIVYNTTDLQEHQFSSYLKGFESGWSSWQKTNHRKFSNLPPGKYTFLVKARTPLGVYSDVAKLEFRVSPPLLLSPYFFALYIIILVLLIYFMFKGDKKERKPFASILNRKGEKNEGRQELSERFFGLSKNKLRDPARGKPRLLSQRYSLVTVLFSDIQGFTQIAEQMNPEALVDELDSFFFYFDLVVEKHNIEKIKTIGDAYMAAGGIPDKNRTNPVEVVLAAIEVQDYMKRLKKREENIWDLRIGIHTGAVIAGVVGHRKVSYDIWGDTVNTASRMESSSEAGKINISEQTYELVKDFFICEYRGKMPVKYKGEIDMYFVKGIRPELSVNLKNIPNKRFLLQLQMVRFHDLEDEVHGKLENELPPNLFFHDLKHTKEVVTQIELLGRAENISDEEQLILKTAALLHDLGYVDDFENHEQRSTELARDILPAFNYSPGQVKQVCKLILSTKYPFKPGDHLEMMLIDADLSYLGRADYVVNIIKLYKEFKERGKVTSFEEWKEIQREFIGNHRFFTSTAGKLADISKVEQLQNIEKMDDPDLDKNVNLY